MVLGVVVALCLNSRSNEYYPENILGTCVHFPISRAEESNGIVAKLEIHREQLASVLRWYKSCGFDENYDSEETYGYGPHGLSFSISATNRSLILVVKEWKDF
jgi:hypothetical protein